MKKNKSEGEILKQYLYDQRMSAKSLANKIGLDRQTIYYYYKQVYLSHKVKKKLAEEIGDIWKNKPNSATLDSSIINDIARLNLSDNTTNIQIINNPKNDFYEIQINIEVKR